MKKKLKKNELEKVTGGNKPFIPTTPETKVFQKNRVEGIEMLKVYHADKPADANPQSEGTPEGLPLPQ